MQQFGLKSDFAISGDKAINLVKKRLENMERSNSEMYKLIFLDFSMPDLDGPQTSTAIR